MISVDQRPLIEFLVQRLKLAPTHNLRAIGNVSSSGEILGVCGYDNFNGASCECHFAGQPGWITREMCWVGFDYPFNKLGCNVIIAPVSSLNTLALDIDRRLGFKVACTIPGAVKDGDLHILTMHKHECKWIKENYYGKRDREHERASNDAIQRRAAAG